MPVDPLPPAHKPNLPGQATRGLPTAKFEFQPVLRGIWRRRKFLIIALFLVTSVPLVLLTYLKTRPAYVATATIALEAGVIEQLPQLFREMPRRDNIVAHLAMARSRSFTEAVVAALPPESINELLAHGEYRDYVRSFGNFIRRLLGKPEIILTPHDRAVAELQFARMTFTQSRQSPAVVTVAGSASTPIVARDLVNTSIQVLITRTQGSNQGDAQRARQFLEAQIQQAREAQRVAEANLSRFEAQKGRMRTSAQADFGLIRLTQLESQLAEAQANRDVTAARITAIREAMERDRAAQSRVAPQSTPSASTPTETSRSATSSPANEIAFRSAQERLTSLERRLSTLRERYTDAHPSVRAALEEIARERARVNELASQVAPPPAPRERAAAHPTPAATVPTQQVDRLNSLARLEEEAAGHRSRIEALTLQLQQAQAGLRSGTQDEMQYSNLRSAVDAARQRVVTLSERLTTARMREQGDSGVIRVIDPPGIPSEPSQSPQRLALLAVALCGCLAVGTAFATEAWRQPVETEEDVTKAIDVPLLGSVGVLKPSGKPKQPIALPYRDKTIHMELYRAIRANIETERLKSAFRTVLVTSPGPHEGKSTTVLNLAHAFHEFGRRVVVIDADLRRPSLFSALGLTNKPGIVDFLLGKATFEQVCRLLPAGPTIVPGQVAHGDPAALLASARFQELLATASSQFDLVLVDSAPILAVPDDLMLLHMMDRVLLVAKATETSVRDLRKTRKVLDNGGGCMLGVVLNHAHPRDVAYYHPRYRKYYTPAETTKDGARAIRSPKPAPKRTGP